MDAEPQVDKAETRKERPVRVVIGPPRGPGKVGVWYPMAMMESPAWQAHVDEVRRSHAARLAR